MSDRTIPRLGAVLLALIAGAAADGQNAPAPAGPGTIKFDQQAEGFWGTLSGKQALHPRDPGVVVEDPARKQTWLSEQAWRCELGGPLAVFGQVGATGEEPERQDVKVTGKTGVACQVPALFGAEVLLRGGPLVNCTDPLRAVRTQAQTQVLVEVLGRVPLLGAAALEVQTTATPALSPLGHEQFLQDVRLAFPVGTSGKLKVGAQHRWEGEADPRPLPDGKQLYLRLELAR